ncbi:hypothetical protein QQ045_029353 [Rhodiola kirilowii]
MPKIGAAASIVNQEITGKLREDISMKAQTTFLMVVARQGNTGVRPCAEEGISSADDNPCLPQCMSLLVYG